MNHQVKLYRKRYYPEETIFLKDDRILELNEDYIITSWNSLKPRKDIASGISAYFPKKGIKVSKVFRDVHQVVYWYCDIISTSYNEESRSYVFTDLLVDILVYEDGSVRVVDLDELAQFIELEKISKKEVVYCLNCASNLLKDIDHGSFAAYQDIINRYDRTQTS